MWSVVSSVATCKKFLSLQRPQQGCCTKTVGGLAMLPTRRVDNLRALAIVHCLATVPKHVLVLTYAVPETGLVTRATVKL